MTDLDKSRLIAAIAARLKIRLDEDDPAFVLVELNRLVLDQTVRDALQRVRQLGAVRPQPRGEEFAREFADLVAQSVVAKLPKPEAPARKAPKALAWTAALGSVLAVFLLALTVCYQLGTLACGLK